LGADGYRSRTFTHARAITGGIAVSQSLRPANTLQRVYLYRDPIVFRKSYRGLSAIVELELGHNPFDGELYVLLIASAIFTL
jgi:hypothetical protein